MSTVTLETKCHMGGPIREVHSTSGCRMEILNALVGGKFLYFPGWFLYQVTKTSKGLFLCLLTKWSHIFPLKLSSNFLLNGTVCSI